MPKVSKTEAIGFEFLQITDSLEEDVKVLWENLSSVKERESFYDFVSDFLQKYNTNSYKIGNNQELFANRNDFFVYASYSGKQGFPSITEIVDDILYSTDKYFFLSFLLYDTISYARQLEKAQGFRSKKMFLEADVELIPDVVKFKSYLFLFQYSLLKFYEGEEDLNTRVNGFLKLFTLLQAVKSEYPKFASVGQGRSENLVYSGFTNLIEELKRRQGN